jgi:hypothetical protein
MVSLMLAAVGCGDDGPPLRDAGDDASVVVKTHGRVLGQVFRADTLQPVADVKITGPHSVTATSDAQGKFELSMLETQRTALIASIEGFARAIEPVEVVANQAVSVEFRLLPVSASAELDSSKGGEVRAASGAAVTVDEGAFLDAQGKPVTGMVSVELTVLDPSTPAGLRAFPGDFAATSKSGSDGQLETFVPMEVTVRSGDEVLDFAKGKGAEVNFPVPDGLKDKAPQTIALWSLSTTTGAWQEEGSATLITDGSGQLVYRGRLTHMSWWNCDRFMDRVTCVRGCVTKDGNAASRVTTQAEGIDYSNIGQDLTDDKGCFAQDVKAGAQLRVRALTTDATSEWKVITAPETLMKARDNRDACMDVGTLELVGRKAEDMSCPSGTTKCGDACVDVATDYDNCGRCGNSCFGTVRGAQCIAGQCACNGSETKCQSIFERGSACTDLKFDEMNCGACGKQCASGQTCEDGACKQLSCSAGLTLCGSTCVDTSGSGQHCGKCDAPCAMGQSCNAGTCEALHCPDSLEMCGTACVVKGTCMGAADCTRTYRCDDSSTVSVCKLCDGTLDCKNGKDEASSSTGGACTMCPNGKLATACNGVKECAGGEDEQGCGGSVGGAAGSGGSGSGGSGGSTGSDTGAGGSGGSAGKPVVEPTAGNGGSGGNPTGAAGSGGAAGGGVDASPDAGLGGSGGAAASGTGGIGGRPGGGGVGGAPDTGGAGGAAGSSTGGIGGGPGGGGVGGIDPGPGGAGGAAGSGTGGIGGRPGGGGVGGTPDTGGSGGAAGSGTGGIGGGPGGGGVGGIDPGPGGAGGAAGSGTGMDGGVAGGPPGAGIGGGGGRGGSGGIGGGNCGPDDFECPDTTCITKLQLCDNVNDCSDGSDEANCSPCQGQVQCPDLSCAPSPDQCPNTSCPADMVTCPGGGCAPSIDLCGGGGGGCDPKQIACDDAQGSPICANECDQVTECGNGADEDVSKCCDQQGGVLCQNVAQDMVCVTADHVCAGDGDQCADGSDENPQLCCDQQGGMYCEGAQGPLCVPSSQICANDGSQCLNGADEDTARCCRDKGGLLCKSGECIDPIQQCDQATDCSDGSDESPETCCHGPDSWLCADGSLCITNAQRCNGGLPDCGDGSDELGCGCPNGQVTCPDKSCAVDIGSCPVP